MRFLNLFSKRTEPIAQGDFKDVNSLEIKSRQSPICDITDHDS